jgi:hypothetical protein
MNRRMSGIKRGLDVSEDRNLFLLPQGVEPQCRVANSQYRTLVILRHFRLRHRGVWRVGTISWKEEMLLVVYQAQALAKCRKM